MSDEQIFGDGKTEGLVLHAGNVRKVFESAYDMMQKYADDAARYVGLMMDFDLFWQSSPEGQATADRARELNRRGDRTLSIFDRRTRGGKYYAAEEQRCKACWLAARTP